MRAGLSALLLCGCTALPPELPPQPAPIVYPKASVAAPAPSALGAPWVSASPPPPTGLDVPARDRRRTGRRPAVVTSEIASLESLLKNPSPAAPPRVNVLRYLADDYVELRKAGQNRSPDVIATLSQIIAGYPQDPLIDEALDLPNAHGAYLDLIRLHLPSRWVAPAHFALGELLLREAKTDATKWVLALSEYDETIKDGNSVLLPDALWRSGQAADRAGDPVRASAFYARLRHDYPDSAAAARIGEVP